MEKAADGSSGGMRLARKKKYTPAALKRRVNEYFDSISVTKTEEDCILNNGKPLSHIYYYIPPTVCGLCRYLHISRETWSRYGRGEMEHLTDAEKEEYRSIVQDARDRIEAWLTEELLTRTKGFGGIEFVLKNNFGYEDRQVIQGKVETSAPEAQTPMTIEEKEALLRAVRKIAGEKSILSFDGGQETVIGDEQNGESGNDENGE